MNEYIFFKVKGPAGFLFDFAWDMATPDELVWCEFNRSMNFDSRASAEGFIEEYGEQGGDAGELSVREYRATEVEL